MNHHDLFNLLRDTGFPVDICWMGYDRSCEVDWAWESREGEYQNGPFYRYNPSAGDNDDIMDRYGGGKELKSPLRGSCVQFSEIENVDALPGTDWYRYEKLRNLGEGTIRWEIDVQHGELHSQLDRKATGTEWDEARRLRYIPFTFKQFNIRHWGRVMVGAPLVS